MKVSHYLQGSIILIHGRVYKLRLHTIIQGAVTKQTKKEYGQNVNWEIKIEYWNTHELIWFKNSKKSEQSYYRENNYIGTDGTVKKQMGQWRNETIMGINLRC